VASIPDSGWGSTQPATAREGGVVAVAFTATLDTLDDATGQPRWCGISGARMVAEHGATRGHCGRHHGGDSTSPNGENGSECQRHKKAPAREPGPELRRIGVLQSRMVMVGSGRR
jgi:hypothetical protein